jgi:hypothetical protein
LSLWRFNQDEGIMRKLIIDMALVTIAALVLAAYMVCAEEPRKDQDEAWARAQAAIAVAKAKAKQPKIVALTKPLPYSDAVKVAKSEKKPLVVTVALNCAGLCRELRPDFVTCHEPTFEGSVTPRMLLLMHGDDGVLYKLHVWATLPPEAEVRAKVKEWAPRLAPHAAVRQELIEAAILEMFALEFDGVPPCPPGFERVNGTCQQVANQAAAPTPDYSTASGQGYQWMPSPPVTNLLARGEDLSRRFGHRFKSFRHRVSCALGLPPRGDWARTPALVGASPTRSGAQMSMTLPFASKAQPTMPEIVGGPVLQHRLIKAYLVKRGVDAGDLEKLETKYGAGTPILSQLLKLLLEEGLPIVLEWLKSLLA